mmetsp:Transcript_31211/g.56616  ORF Transcript_31211/g.56616 Transcript_31211/m.56616 type:complete len:211 (+) Transcript_31211:1077-1709(+)
MLLTRNQITGAEMMRETRTAGSPCGLALKRIETSVMEAAGSEMIEVTIETESVITTETLVAEERTIDEIGRIEIVMTIDETGVAVMTMMSGMIAEMTVMTAEGMVTMIARMSVLHVVATSRAAEMRIRIEVAGKIAASARRQVEAILIVAHQTKMRILAVQPQEQLMLMSRSADRNRQQRLLGRRRKTVAGTVRARLMRPRLLRQRRPRH